MSRITFGGLASGLDTNHLIDQLLQLQAEPIERKEKQIEELQVKQDTWRDVNMRMRHLRETVNGLKDPDTFLTKQAYSSDETVVSATVDYSAEDASYDLEVEQLASYHRVASEKHVSELGLDNEPETANDALGLEGSFKFPVENGDEEGEDEVEDIVIEVSENDSLNSIRNKINASEAEVEASVINGHLILQSTVSGEEGEIKVEDPDGILEALRIFGPDEDNGDLKFYNETSEAQNAVASINGIPVERSTNQIDDVIDGVTFHLDGTTTNEELGDSPPVTIQISTNTEPAVEAVNAFVEQYNSTNDYIREKLDKDGQLQGDTTLMRAQSKLRTLVSQPVRDATIETEEGVENKKFTSFSSLGVTTLDEDGYLQFNPEQLTQAIQEDPEAVYDVFKYEIKDEDGQGTDEYSGVAVELENYMQRLLQNTPDDQGRTMRAITAQEEQSIQRRIDSLYQRIERREERLMRYEDRLIRQFTALERAIATMNSQSEEMTRMVDQLPGFGGG